MIHSIVPWEQMMEGADQMKAPEEITYRGLQMQVEFLSPSQARIVRLLCPLPEPYLDPDYAPGTVIRLVPEQ